MTMQAIDVKNLSAGGAGFHGDGPDLGKALAALVELQGLTFSLLAGAAANTTIALAAIRQEDTIVAALNNNAGTITDIKANVSINDCRANGTITLSGVTAGQTVNVNGVTYTAVAGAAANYNQFSIDGNDTADAAALAAAINAREANYGNSVTASSNAGVVTVTATAEGTGPNAYVLTKSGAGITVSGAGTLTGGTVTGGIKSTSITNQVLLLWFNKR